jgi:molybdenum cofactor cytidylyltransferase
VLQAWNLEEVVATIMIVRRGDLTLQQAVNKHAGVVLVLADDPAEMSASVAVGLEYVERNFQPTNDDAWLLAPADMPHLAPTIIRELLRQHAASEKREILVPTLGGRRGHPVLFPWGLQAEVRCLAPGEGINQLLKKFPSRLVPCDRLSMSDEPFADLNTPEDYQRYRER